MKKLSEKEKLGVEIIKDLIGVIEDLKDETPLVDLGIAEKLSNTITKVKDLTLKY